MCSPLKMVKLVHKPPHNPQYLVSKKFFKKNQKKSKKMLDKWELMWYYNLALAKRRGQRTLKIKQRRRKGTLS